jgi:hypothetical protein
MGGRETKRLGKLNSNLVRRSLLLSRAVLDDAAGEQALTLSLSMRTKACSIGFIASSKVIER